MVSTSHRNITGNQALNGTGMAVAKAQYAISEMVQSLKAKGINCRFGIHPVAGRMPGQVSESPGVASFIKSLIWDS